MTPVRVTLEIVVLEHPPGKAGTLPFPDLAYSPFTAYCPSVRPTFVCRGSTREEAIKNLTERIKYFLHEDRVIAVEKTTVEVEIGT